MLSVVYTKLIQYIPKYVFLTPNPQHT